MYVTNLNSPRSGTPVANQYEINDVGVSYFQSHQTLIAKKEAMTYTISSNWNYSRTTAKYFAHWLRSYGFNDFEIETLKKWLRKSSTVEGSNLVELLGGRVNIKYVEEL